MTFIIIGAVLAAVAVGLLFGSRSQGEKALQLKSSKAGRVQDIVQLQKDIAGDLGAGSFRDTVEVRGKPQIDTPLRAELSGSPCLYYSVSITREYEETYTERDSEGKSQTKTRRGSDTISSNTRSVPFLVNDGTGTIEIRPEGADVELVKTVDTFEQGDPGNKISFKNFSFQVGLPVGGRRTLGYRYQEHILPVDQDVFVFGEVSDSNNVLRIGRPEKKGLFIISHRLKDDIVRSAEGAAKGMKIGAIVSAVLAVAGIVVGILYKQ